MFDSLRKPVLAILAFLLAGDCVSHMAAQGKQSILGRLVEFISAPSRELDPAAVYQPTPSWNVSVSGDLRHAGIDQRHAFDVGIAMFDEQGLFKEDKVPAHSYSEIRGNMDKSIGLQVGYGNVSLGWNQKVFGSKDYSNTSMDFDYFGTGYALQLQYMDIRKPMDFEMTIGEESDELHYSHVSGETNYPARLRAFIADLYYAFNTRTFAYSSVYKGDKVQRRSAGSFMFGTKFINGMVHIRPEEMITTLSGGLGRYSTTQVSFGGGYSYNLVAFHHQPVEGSDEGLKNLTFNLTAIPMVTLFNQFTSKLYQYQSQTEDFPLGEKSSMNGNLKVNYVTRAGMNYTFGKNTLSLYGSFDTFAFKGETNIPFKDLRIDTVQTIGVFERWSAGIRYGMRF